MTHLIGAAHILKNHSKQSTRGYSKTAHMACFTQNDIATLVFDIDTIEHVFD